MKLKIMLMLIFICNKGLVIQYFLFIFLYRLNKFYEVLEYGFEVDVFIDLIGGFVEWYNFVELKEYDFYFIRVVYQCGVVIGCLSVVSVVFLCKELIKLKK